MGYVKFTLTLDLVQLATNSTLCIYDDIRILTTD